MTSIEYQSPIRRDQVAPKPGNNSGNPHEKPMIEKILVKKGWYFSPFCCIIESREGWLVGL
jgi:hypothetical protein